MGTMREPALIAKAEACMRHIRSAHLTFCAGSRKLEHLLAALLHCREAGTEGLYLEAGVAMGGSAMLMAQAKPPEAVLRLYDVFDMLPPPGEQDGQQAQAVYERFLKAEMLDATSRNYLAHTPDMLAFVRHNFAQCGIDPGAQHVEFVKGLFEETLHPGAPVAFAHIDCDWYDSVCCCIERIRDRMGAGGLFVFDDYHSFDGCRQAVDAWLAEDTRFRIVSKEWTLVVQRQEEA